MRQLALFVVSLPALSWHCWHGSIGIDIELVSNGDAMQDLSQIRGLSFAI